MNTASYRKHNDGSHSSSTYHKKDGTNMRSILKRESEQEMSEETAPLKIPESEYRKNVAKYLAMSKTQQVHVMSATSTPLLVLGAGPLRPDTPETIEHDLLLFGELTADPPPYKQIDLSWLE